MAGRPPLRIGQHGRIVREHLGGGVWLARTRFRDADGVTRRVQRLGPADEYDKHGKLAYDALLEALLERRTPVANDVITSDTRVSALVEQHLKRLEDKGRSPATMDTYREAAGKLNKFIGGVRVYEATAGRINSAIDAMRSAHGATMARQARTVLSGGMQLAVLAEVIDRNPVREVESIERTAPRSGAVSLTVDELRGLMVSLRQSDYCQEHDLVDPVTLFIATGLRRSELLALRWSDFDADTGTLTVAGKVVRAKGKGLIRMDTTKTAAGARTVALPQFAIDTLTARRQVPFTGEQETVFASTAGTLRDPNNFGKQWRKVRDDLGVPKVTTHSFRKALASLLDDRGLSARVAADVLGHAHVSMTQNTYMSRGRVHIAAADALESAINDE